MKENVIIQEVIKKGDARGYSYSLPKEFFEYLPDIKDVHIMTLKPNHIRGNHYHRKKNEIIYVQYVDDWVLFYDSGLKTKVTQNSFSQSGAVIITIPPMFSHAIKNIGNKDMFLVGFTDMPYGMEDQDAFFREVVQPLS